MELRRISLLLSLFLTTVDARNLLVNEFFNKGIPDEETFLTQSDFDRALLRVRSKRDVEEDEDFDDTAMYNSGLFEGDIANPGLNSQNIRSFVGDEPFKTEPGAQHNAKRDFYTKWPNGRVPYTISTQFNDQSRQRIAAAFHDYKTKTCIRFVPKTDQDHNYVHIIPGNGCWSMVGRVGDHGKGGKQTLSLGDGCLNHGVIDHELMHAIGFFHEQSRADRDDYVTIKWENMDEEGKSQFQKYSLSVIDHLGTEYDYDSLMHYNVYDFSKNGLPTILPKKNGVKIGQRRGLSPTDVYKINKHYACELEEQTTKAPVPTHGPIPTHSPFPTNDKCTDEAWNCSHLKKSWTCGGTASHFMQSNCAATCGFCQKSGTCANSDDMCDGFARGGMCQGMFQDFMKLNCPVSCGLC